MKKETLIANLEKVKMRASVDNQKKAAYSFLKKFNESNDSLNAEFSKFEKDFFELEIWEGNKRVLIEKFTL